MGEFILGGIYLASYDEKRYVTFKVMQEDEQGIHVSLYNNFSDHIVDYCNLDTDYYFCDKKILIGHMPILKESFKGIHPVFRLERPIEEQELERIQLWTDSKGGYWNDSFKEYLMSFIKFD